MPSNARWTPPTSAVSDVAQGGATVPLAIRVASRLIVAEAIAQVAVQLWWSVPTPPLDEWAFEMLVGQVAVVAVMVGIAALVRVRRAWPRVVLALLVALEIWDYVVNGSVAGRYATLPSATLRDGLGFLAEVIAVSLLFTPAASRWYRRVDARSLSSPPPPT